MPFISNAFKIIPCDRYMKSELIPIFEKMVFFDGVNFIIEIINIKAIMYVMILNIKPISGVVRYDEYVSFIYNTFIKYFSFNRMFLLKCIKAVVPNEEIKINPIAMYVFTDAFSLDIHSFLQWYPIKKKWIECKSSTYCKEI